MAHIARMINRQDVKTFIHQVDKLLWEEWDPIGCGVPEDEYTTYAHAVASKAINGESKQQIMDYLDWAESEYMGMSRHPEAMRSRNEPIVQKILLWAKSVKNPGS